MFQVEEHVSVVASCLYEVILNGKAIARWSRGYVFLTEIIPLTFKA